MNPSLDDLSLLASVVRHRGFRRAAAEAGVSPSSLSERIRALEDRLGVRLLNRTTRSVSPTEAGEALMARIGPALDDLAQAVAATGLPADAPVGRLRINAPGAADTALGPLIAPFLQAHPGVQLEIVVDNAFTDVVGEGFDAGVRYGERLDKDMIAVPLGGPERFVLVAAPSLL
ncbi:MAG: LysR family transcriptional regulator, partial [Brevundimonas sp.]